MHNTPILTWLKVFSKICQIERCFILNLKQYVEEGDQLSVGETDEVFLFRLVIEKKLANNDVHGLLKPLLFAN